jgi:hypothetical protein
LNLILPFTHFSDSVYTIFACFGTPAPPLIGVAPVNIRRTYELLEFFWKISRTSRTMMNNVPKTIFPVHVLV